MPEPRYRTSVLWLLITLIGIPGMARQEAAVVKTNSGKKITTDTLPAKTLQEVVVTGQYEPQSLKRSVYQVRTISAERIKLQGATNLTGVLNNDLGIRFSNDRTLGTTDIELMGMSGRNVKILLDGVPMVDRGDTRESLNQIDVHTIERIEIVEGPMSVSYGSDALAGVINIITKRSTNSLLSITAGVQEESAGNEYDPFLNKGVHNQYAGITWQKKGWTIALNGSHNDFGGWKESRDTALSRQEWHPKEQFMGAARVGYRNNNFNVWYRINALDETILNNGPVFSATNTTFDQKFFTNRYLHQLQAEWRVNDKLLLNAIGAYTDYKRRTQTVNIDLATGKRTLSTGLGEQDVSKFNSTVFRATAQYKISSIVSVQPGVDINIETATGARILGKPSIEDYAFFASAEIKPTAGISIRPGLRFIHNSVYDAPPVIPSINTKFELTKDLDLRLAYARGFRSPALRELYFNFFDASHSIKGNPNLKAEHSNSFNGSLTWYVVTNTDMRMKTVLSGFYNDFKNQINYGLIAGSDTTTLVNIDKFKTTGGMISGTLNWKQWELTAGFAYIGRYNSFSDDSAFKADDLPSFVWTPEVNANLFYNIPKIGTKLSFFYKFTGTRPTYQIAAGSIPQTVQLAKTASFHWADFTVSKTLFKYLTLNGGVKNIFDVTDLRNTATDNGGAHSANGPVPFSYGRSWFAGLNFQWN